MIVIGLILEGGGMRGGFVAGALMALMDRGLTGFDFSVAVSASVPTLAYFAAGQRDEIEKVWRNELVTPKLVCYKNIPAASLALSTKRPVLDIDYLVYEVFKKKYPLEIGRLMKSEMTCCFAVTELSRARLTLLSPGDDDIYKIFKAAIAVPGCYPATVRIDRWEYMDGGIANLLPVHLLLERKVDKIIAILSTPIDDKYKPLNLLERTLLSRYFRRNPWILRRLWEAARTYEEERTLLKELAKQEPPRAFIIYPDKMPPVRFITRNRKKVNQTIDLGYEKVKELEDRIRVFLNEETVRSDPSKPRGGL
jgi:predicted patatin/cPLA2 family phospholipase